MGIIETTAEEKRLVLYVDIESEYERCTICRDLGVVVLIEFLGGEDTLYVISLCSKCKEAFEDRFKPRVVQGIEGNEEE